MSTSIQLSPDFIKAVSAQAPVGGLTHDFYRYPARFSPELARAAILELSSPGDTVIDPFMGGGTSVVEALAHGRNCIGSDINELGVFVTKAKTRPLTPAQQERVGRLVQAISEESLAVLPEIGPTWRQDRYLRNLNCRHSWSIRDSIGLALTRLKSLPTAPERHFLRCVVLRTAQLAIDGRRTFPSAVDFRRQLRRTGQRMLESIEDLRSLLSHGQKALVLNRRADSLGRDSRLARFAPPSLILTSPPYPGVHVLYHRWQLLGGRETPAPFWITNCNDGQGASHYTFGDRRTHTSSLYFRTLQQSFASLASIAQPHTIFVQVVGFSRPKSQLPRYLRVLQNAGLIEVLPRWNGQRTKRLWRSIPNRRWYNWARPGLSSEREVVLFHRLGP